MKNFEMSCLTQGTSALRVDRECENAGNARIIAFPAGRITASRRADAPYATTARSQAAGTLKGLPLNLFTRGQVLAVFALGTLMSIVALVA